MAAETKESPVPAPADAPEVSPIVALITGDKNERGIPSAVFIDSIGSFVAEHGLKAEDLYGELSTLHGKYKLMESQLEEGRTRAKRKMPELEASLDSIAMLRKKKEAGEAATAFYELSDNVQVQARIDSSVDRVAVWLGANVMVEYSYDEATTLLGEQLEAATTKVKTNTADLAFLRDQIITTEVNSARVYNFIVRTERAKKMAELAAAGVPLPGPAAAVGGAGAGPAAAAVSAK